MKAAILTIGDEILNGQTLDTNSAWLGRKLHEIGISVEMRLSVGDTHEEIINGFDQLFVKVPVVISTGGLGPTKDDVTKKAIVEYFKDKMVFNQQVYDRIVDYFEKTGRKPTKAHKAQSNMPQKAVLINNNHGTAPGMWLQDDKSILLSLPGVPVEMKGIMIDGGLTKLEALNSSQKIHFRVIQTVDLGETRIAEQIEDILEEFPPEIQIAYLPGLGAVKLRLTGKGEDDDYLKSQLEIFNNRIAERLGEVVFGYGEIKLEEVIGQIAIEKGLTIGTAESCTGGAIASRITSVPGSSAYFEGSVVSYSNDIKSEILGVDKYTLESKGAVSKETVEQMVQGLIRTLSVDVAVAVSGIAGPNGGTPDKPVGTVWMAVGNKQRIVFKVVHLAKNRNLNIQYSVIKALDMLRLFMLDTNPANEKSNE